MSEVAMNHKAHRDGRYAKFFITANYVQQGADVCLLDLQSFETNITPFFEADKKPRVILATGWEERGHDNGNPHWHGIVELHRNSRMRPLQFTEWLISTCNLNTRPHVEICRNLKQAAEYRDKQGKAELWKQYETSGRDPYFFRIDPDKLLEHESGRGRRTDILQACTSAASYEDLV